MEEQVKCEINPKPVCDRCGDMYYHPRTVIEDQRQRAREWEDVAVSKDARISQLAAQVEGMREVVERAQNFERVYRARPNNSHDIQKALLRMFEAIAKLEGKP